MHPEDITFDLVPFLILILSILVKLWMAAFNRKLGKKIDSKVMLATAADSLGDVITTSATVVSILICYVANVNIDAIAGLIVSLLVIWSGFSIAKDTLEPLIGQRVPAELYQKISQMVESYDGIVGTHDLIVHNYGPNQGMATIHAEVPNDVNIEVSHAIIDRIEREVGKELNITLVIHIGSGRAARCGSTSVKRKDGTYHQSVRQQTEFSRFPTGENNAGQSDL